MEKQVLTDRICEAAPGPDGSRGYLIHYDRDTKGFGLRVTRAGAKSFVLNYRVQTGEERRLTIGTFKDPWWTAEARKEALRLKRIIDQGGDPQGEKNAIRAAPTVGDLIERWRSDHAPKNRKSTRDENEKLIAQWIAPELGRRRVADLRVADIEALHAKISRRTPYRANRVLALLSRLLSLAVRWEMRPDNPCRAVERNTEEKRYRYLKPEELLRLTAALAEYPDRRAVDAIRLLVLTGARSGEVFEARWNQFDLERGVWTKPSSHTKQKREHVVPLSAPARQLLAEMPRTGERLFPGLTSVRHQWEKICRASGLEGLRVHDLRHSYASFLASAGQSLPIIGALLGHTQASTTQRYAHLLLDPLQAATDRAGAIITAAAGGQTADIVKLFGGGKTG